ncbi:GNAT family N-acetyltransferase [Niallia sp. 03133]|uniref:GNAT family N-acetyltransferase n=1 Tax=Niallia sp. 03133 TaxID=3458060 RepID=UPI0040439D5E
MEIRKLRSEEYPPMELLLLADPSKELVDEYINRGECYLVFIKQQVVGAYVLLSTRPQTVELVNVVVKEEHRGKGIGKKLVLSAIQTARKNSYKTMEIGTGNSSIGQLALYQKCGFRIIGIDKDYFLRHYIEEIFENGIQCRDMIRLSLDL